MQETENNNKNPNRFATQNWPVEIHLKKQEKCLEITYEDGTAFRYPAEYLRVFSPSAEVQGHSPSERKLVTGRAHVGIMELEEVGNYAIRIIFDDMHDTGIFSWQYLYQLGEEYPQRWEFYLQELEEAQKSRFPN